MQETRVRSLGQEDLLEKEMVTHSSFLAWKMSCTEEPEGLYSMGSRATSCRRVLLADLGSPGQAWAKGQTVGLEMGFSLSTSSPLSALPHSASCCHLTDLSNFLCCFGDDACWGALGLFPLLIFLLPSLLVTKASYCLLTTFLPSVWTFPFSLSSEDRWLTPLADVQFPAWEEWCHLIAFLDPNCFVLFFFSGLLWLALNPMVLVTCIVFILGATQANTRLSSYGRVHSTRM